MRKLITLLVAAFLFAGCGGESTQDGSQSSSLPDFILNPPLESGVIYGSGIEKNSSAQMAKEAADLRAKKEIAQVLSQKIAVLMEDFLKSAGVSDNEQTKEFTQSVTRSVSLADLTGTQIVKREYIDGTMYSLAKLPLDSVAREKLMEIINQDLAEREAIRAELEAKDALSELDQKIDQMMAQ